MRNADEGGAGNTFNPTSNNSVVRSLLNATKVEIVPIFKTNDGRNLKKVPHFSSGRKRNGYGVTTEIVCLMGC